MASVSTVAEKSRGYVLCLADVVFLLAALAVLRVGQHSLLDDPGLGWHLRNIDAMLQQRGWLTHDPFTDPRAESPPRWLSNQWLGELPFYLGWKWASLEGITLVNALVIALLCRCLYLRLLDDTQNWSLALLWTVLALMGTSCSWNARPNLFTILFLFYTADLCMRLHQERVGWSERIALVVLFAVWANTHGGFLAGLMTLGITLLIEGAYSVVAPTAELRRQALRRTTELTGLCSACSAATLVNPYGIGLYSWVLGLLGDRYFMDLHLEWLSPDFRAAGAMRFEILFLLLPAVLALSSRRCTLVEIGLCVLWLHQALTGFRYVALWVVVVVPILARCSVQIDLLNDLAHRWHIGTSPSSLFHTPQGYSPWWATLLITVVLAGWAHLAQGTFARHDQKAIASQAMDRLISEARRWQQARGERPVIFHSYDWGGYLTWHGWPELLNWIDDRNEVQGKERIAQYLAILRAEPGWQNHLRNIQFVCIPPTTPLARSLLAMPEIWHVHYQDEYAIVFERR